MTDDNSVLQQLAQEYSGPVKPIEMPAEAPSQAVAQAAPQLDTSPVNVFDDTGELVSIPAHRLEDAKAQGYREATPEDVHDWDIQQKYGSGTQQLGAAAEGAASAATFGLSTGLETGLGIATPEEIQGRREANPISYGAGQVAGLVGSSLLVPGGGAAGALTLGGETAAKALGLAGAENTLARVGSAVVRGAVDNALFQTGDEVSKLLSKDPNQSVGSAVTDIGLSGLLGGGLSGVGAGVIKPLWKATVGGKVGTFLDVLSKRAGGIEGETAPNPIESLANKAGMDLKPEVMARLSGDPHAQALASALEQSDMSSSGRGFQQSMQEFRKGAGDSMVEAFGVAPDAIKPEIDRYNTGKSLGETLASEYKAQMDPLAKEFEALKSRVKNVELAPDKEIVKPADYSNPYHTVPESVEKQPGAISQLSDKIAQLSEKEGWSQSPSSDIMKGIRTAMKELQDIKTVDGLDQYATRVGENMQSDPLNGPLRRAGGMVKALIRDAVSDTLERRLGAEAGPEAVGRFKVVRQAFAEQARLKDALKDRLGVRGSVSSYDKAIREMARTDGESVLNRLSGKNDANLLELLQEKAPQTAEALRQYHRDHILSQAASKAKAGETISASHMQKLVDNMSPQLRDFVIPKEAQGKIAAVAELLEKARDTTHNWSNTARTMDKLMAYVPGSALGIVTMLASHNPAASLAVGAATKALGRDVPDAARLALLKFMGSSKPISSEGFGAMTNYIHAVMKGENLTAKAIKGVFQGAKDVLPHAVMPTEKDREKLDKKVKQFQENPNAFDNIEDKTGHYLPEHGAAVIQTAAQALHYVASQRPNQQKLNPFDSPPVISSSAKAAYNRTLDIAEQPLVVLHKVSEGTLTPKDVQDLKSMYPGTYARLMTKMQDQITEHVSKGGDLPYKARMGLSLLSGLNLDSSLSPQSLQAVAQANASSHAAQQQAQTAPKKNTSALAKLPGQYRTPDQAREAHIKES